MARLQTFFNICATNVFRIANAHNNPSFPPAPSAWRSQFSLLVPMTHEPPFCASSRGSSEKTARMRMMYIHSRLRTTPRPG
eukprot:scaffold197894_cov31-Tisochrysis_lutea.AAC.3